MSAVMFESGINIKDIVVVKRRMLEYISHVECGADERKQFIRDATEMGCIVRILKCWDPADDGLFTDNIKRTLSAPPPLLTRLSLCSLTPVVH
jgi:hypothetical protein